MDGVINVLSRTPDLDPAGFERVFAVRTADGRGPFVIRVAQGTRKLLEALADQFEIVWATTWMDEASRLLAPAIGVGAEWPHVELGEEIQQAWIGAEMTETWKLPAIERWAARTDRPIAWIDDDLGPDAADWARRRTREVAPTLLVETNPFVGLTEEMALDLIAWAGQRGRRRRVTGWPRRASLRRGALPGPTGHASCAPGTGRERSEDQA